MCSKSKAWDGELLIRHRKKKARLTASIISLKWKNILASRQAHLMKPKPSFTAAMVPWKNDHTVKPHNYSYQSHKKGIMLGVFFSNRCCQSVLIERVATLGSKVTQKSSTLSLITKEFQKIVSICLYMVCKHWSSHVRRSYRKLGVFAVQKTRKLGMCCVKCNTFERLWEAIMTSTMIPLLYTHIKLRGYAFRCAKIWWYFAHFLHTHAQSLRN